MCLHLQNIAGFQIQTPRCTRQLPMKLRQDLDGVVYEFLGPYSPRLSLCSRRFAASLKRRRYSDIEERIAYLIEHGSDYDLPLTVLGMIPMRCTLCRSKGRRMFRKSIVYGEPRTYVCSHCLRGEMRVLIAGCQPKLFPEADSDKLYATLARVEPTYRQRKRMRR